MTTGTTQPIELESPPARRRESRRWKDPRLWVGLVLVAASVLVGARLLAAADDTTAVWAVNRDLAPGTPVRPDVLAVERVRFADAAVAARYLPAGEAPPDGAVAAREVAEGELLARSAVRTDARADAAHLPVVVDAAGAPEDLSVGDVVDVWVVPPAAATGSTDPASRVLDDARVVRSSRESGPLGEAGSRQVLLALDPSVRDLGGLLTAITTGTVVLVRAGS